MIPLFTSHPVLAASLPYLSIGDFPTPVEPLAGLSKELGRKDLFIKRDDISGRVYGGNKVRKLEFLLADAKKQGAVRVITTGAAGSNHALATALYARAAGLKSTLVLSEQPSSPVVRGNLLADFVAGAEMLYEERYERIAGIIAEKVAQYEKTEGQTPYVVPAGGSSPLGAVGYVNAAFELKEQIDKGVIAEPSVIVVPLGTMGTAAGLLLGLKAAGLQSELVAVRVVPPAVANKGKFDSLFKAITTLLTHGDQSMPVFGAPEADRAFCNDYYGPGYGVASKEVVAAIDLLQRTDGVHLDETYSGKAFAAFLAMARDRSGRDGPLVFWNTKNSRVTPVETGSIDFHSLPAPFHKYFNQA
jgi:D-cysteine desulfhydrase